MIHDELSLNNSRYELEKLSTYLLSRNTLTPLEKVVAKLSISYIVNLMDPEMVVIYKTVITNTDLWNTWSTPPVVDYLNEQDRATISRICQDVVTISKGGLKKCRMFIMSKMLTLELLEKETTLEYQIYQNFQYIVTNLPYWSKNVVDSEDEMVSRIKGAMKIILDDTAITLKSGENGSSASKEIRIFNESQFNGGINSTFMTSLRSSYNSSTSNISNIMRRRIDLCHCGYNGVELSLTEMKPYCDKLTEQKQEGKCLRINQIIVKKLEQLGVSNNNIQLGMTWCGMKGRLFAIDYDNGVGVAHELLELVLPYKLEMMNKVEDTLLALYNYKGYLVATNSSVLDIFFSSPPSSSAQSSPESPTVESTGPSSLVSSSINTPAYESSTGVTSHLRKHALQEVIMPHTLSSPKRQKD